MTTRVLTIVGFAAAIVALFTLEFLGRRKNSPIPTLGEFLGYAMRPRAGRFLILLGWLWLGWHFFSR
jgi:ABC-type dipeptide/oligopeptide/nickel transport system permease subunit